MPELLFENEIPEEYRAELADFEKIFTYPLGPDDWFRIDHGQDYTRFFRAMGETLTILALREDKIQGMFTAVKRLLKRGNETFPAYYLCDLKVTPGSRSGFIAARLLKTFLKFTKERGISSSYSVTMEGTAATPDKLFGRLGMPPSLLLSRQILLRLSTGGESSFEFAEPSPAQGVFETLSLAQYRPLPSEHSPNRSKSSSKALLLSDKSATGVLEDTLAAKRLFQRDGTEILSGHLSSFAYESPEAGVELLKAARAAGARMAYPAIFCALPERDLAIFKTALAEHILSVAPALIYGIKIDPGPGWNINTSEI